MLLDFCLIFTANFHPQVETVGDKYMLASGLPEKSTVHAKNIALVALDMLDIVREIAVDDHPVRVSYIQGDTAKFCDYPWTTTPLGFLVFFTSHKTQHYNKNYYRTFLELHHSSPKLTSVSCLSILIQGWF